MVTTLMFFQDLFGFLKNGQKKCPKLKTQNTFWKRKSLKYNKSPKQLKEVSQKERKSHSIHLTASMPLLHNYGGLIMYL
jgi:hypothetical protein